MASKQKVLLVYSGGLDSTVLLYFHRVAGYEVSCVNFFYGSKHNIAERRHAERNCASLEIPLTKIDLDFIGNHFKSSLLQSGGSIPEGHYEAESMRSTVVPFRNGIMLSIAAGLADSMGVKAVSIAAHSGDHYIYPDCRPSFLNAFDNAVSAGTENQVRLFRPFCELSKTKIVKLGSDLGVDFRDTWTCYNGGHVHCGVCGACNERKEAFNEAGVEDPTAYIV